MRRFWRAALVISLFADLASGQGSFLKPPTTLKLEGVPEIPASLGDTVQRYHASSPDSMVGWDPVKIEPIFVRHHNNRSWELASVATPGGLPSRIRSLPPGAYGAYQNPGQSYFVFDVDTALGAERIQLFGCEDKGPLIQLTDGNSKNDKPVFSNSGGLMMYSSNRRNRKDMDIYIVDPRDPKSSRMVAQLDGEDWTALDWSPDDQKVLLSDYRMSGETYLWILDVMTGVKARLTDPSSTGKVFNGFHAAFSGDGKGVYHITDRDSDFRRLAYVDIATKRYRYLSSEIGWDIEEFALSPNRKLLAYASNESGFSRLHILDVANKNKEVRLPEMPVGVIEGLRWHNNSEHLGFSFTSGTVAGDIGSLEVRSKRLRWWTRSGVEGAQSTKAEAIKWKSFDGKLIPGFLYRPPPKFTGRRPVIIHVHGGPNAQFRPSFRGIDNYFTFELGAVMIYPNIRGSTGHGKAYLESDNGYNRQDAIKDIGALLDWIRKQPEMNAESVLIMGESYGGYVALSVAADYPDRIVGAITISGPSSLVSYLERTDISRQDRRRAEYGDERDPSMRKFLESIAPFTRADKVKKPLLVVQGRNDTRVAFSEAEQIVAAVKRNGTQVWYALAMDEGHGFGGGRIGHFLLSSQVVFAASLLSGGAISP